MTDVATVVGSAGSVKYIVGYIDGHVDNFMPSVKEVAIFDDFIDAVDKFKELSTDYERVFITAVIGDVMDPLSFKFNVLSNGSVVFAGALTNVADEENDILITVNCVKRGDAE